MRKIKFFMMAALCAGVMASCGSKSEKAAENDDYNADEQLESPAVESDDDGMVEVDDIVIEETMEGVEDATEATADNAQFSSYLKDFESQLSSLITNIKKATSGDAAAIASLTSSLTKLQDLESKMKSITDISPEQKEKAAELYAKLAEKASEVKDLAKGKGSEMLEKVKNSGAMDALKNLGK